MCKLSGRYGNDFEVKVVHIEDDSKDATDEDQKFYLIRKNGVKLCRIRDGGVVDLYDSVRTLNHNDFNSFKFLLACATTK